MRITIPGRTPSTLSVDREAFERGIYTFLTHTEAAGLQIRRSDIELVGVRVVAPGTFFAAHRRIDTEWLERLYEMHDRAPLHTPQLERELLAMREILPHATMIAISDSAFHASMPRVARTYSIPHEDARLYDLYRFGYHGISVEAALHALPLYAPHATHRVIVCHVGSGVSVTAVQDGKSIDTTMGYAPLSGVVMSSRAGDIDPGALLALMEERVMRPREMQSYLQHRGGLTGLAGEADLRTLFERHAEGDDIATHAINVFVYHIQKAIGAMMGALQGVDALIFTGTAGERNPMLRALIAEPFAWCGIVLDEKRNNSCSAQSGCVSTKKSIPVVVIRTDEAAEMLRILENIQH
jgi:acetate kinase